jgi:hypothetical protein
VVSNSYTHTKDRLLYLRIVCDLLPFTILTTEIIFSSRFVGELGNANRSRARPASNKIPPAGFAILRAGHARVGKQNTNKGFE